jgi:pimeloyl-ACP methyl ester carboxylesterase
MRRFSPLVFLVVLFACAVLNATNLNPIPCASITKLRDLAASPGLTYFTNSRTGDQLDYVVLGDGATSSEVIVLFNGTSAILPDWPEQMLTNSTYSPLIVNNDDYDPNEDAPRALCHEYRIVLFDYPGTGLNPASSTFTGDQVADDVDAMLDDVTARYGISTAAVDPGGWSLGTHLALKYSFVAPVSNPARQLHSVLLIAARPGGNTDGFQSGNQAACVQTIITASASGLTSTEMLRRVQGLGIRMIFPYEFQPPYSGSNQVCTATVNYQAGDIDLNVTPNCDTSNHCDQTLVDDAENRKVMPWVLTQGISRTLFTQERDFDNDYNICNCQSAASGFMSTACSCSAQVKSSPSNGGLCQVTSTIPWQPQIQNCAPVTSSGPIVLLNGFEDLYIQWTYGQALIDGFQAGYGMSRATLYTYGGITGAGHGVLFQHPKWAQEHLFLALVAH